MARLSPLEYRQKVDSATCCSGACSIHDLAKKDHGLCHCQYLRGRTKVRVFRSLVLPVLLYGCETWTLASDLRRRLNSFDTESLWKILGYHCSDFVSNERLLRETQMRFVTCIVHERQLRLYGHVAHFPDTDPTHQILLAREPREWRRPTG